MESLIDQVKHAFRAFHDGDADDGDDSVDPSVLTLLSIMPLASIIVDADGEVLVASPSTYEMGVVSNEAIADPTLAKELAAVMRRGGNHTFELVSRTPTHMAGADLVGAPVLPGASGRAPRGAARVPLKSAAGPSSGAAGRADVGDADATSMEVSRRNWLRVHVGKLDDAHAVALIEDLSERKRFERIRDSFVSNVTERLMGPTKALERLARELESGDVDVEMLGWQAHEVGVLSTELDHLIADLLLLLKAQEPIVPAASNRISLMDAVNAALGPLAGRIAERRMTLHVVGDDAIMIHGDHALLVGAVTKLVENAIDYSPAERTIGVAVAKAKDGGHAVLRVIDNGKGIPKGQQERIFERFWRGDSSVPATHGTGLGLAIAKHVALTHHGALTVWSAPGSGSTFTMTLPLAVDDATGDGGVIDSDGNVAKAGAN